MFYFFKTPVFIQKIFSNYLWTIPGDEKVIYLTFDDGPTPEITEWVLSILKKYDAKATFFLEGKNIEKYPHIVERILSLKHQIGNHTFSHNNGWFTNTNKYIKDIEKATKIISKFINISDNSLLFRPPYGKIKTKQSKILRSKGYTIVMFDIISGDFDTNLNREKSLHQVLKHTRSGSIVCFHDSLKAKNNLKHMLPEVLEYWKKRGYKFSAI